MKVSSSKISNMVREHKNLFRVTFTKVLFTWESPTVMGSITGLMEVFTKAIFEMDSGMVVGIGRKVLRILINTRVNI